MINILFVCAGNTCRSPMCEYLFKNMLQQKKIQKNFIDSFSIASCGLCVSTPQPANQNAIKAVLFLTNNPQITQHLSQPLTTKLIENSNYIFALDQFVFDHLSQLYMLQNTKTLHLLNSTGIADPYGSSFETYLETAKTINIALENICETVFQDIF